LSPKDKEKYKKTSQFCSLTDQVSPVLIYEESSKSGKEKKAK